MDADMGQASVRLEDAVRALTRALTDPGRTDQDVAARNLLRALAAYRDAAENPAVLEWVPPLPEIEAGDRVHDTVILFATWVFSVTDEDRAVSVGRRRHERGDPVPPPDSAADVVSAFFDDELDLREETVGDWRRSGLDLEFVQHSTLAMLAGADGAGRSLDSGS